MRILAIVPAFNESEAIAAALADLAQGAPEVEALVVDDGSTDGTAEVALAAGARVARLPVNCGLRAAFLCGIRHARDTGFDAAVQFDADGQHIARYIPAMARAMERMGADVVIASRMLETGAPTHPTGARAVGSKLISWLIRLTTHQSIADPTSGLRLFSRTTFETFLMGFDLGPEPDSLAWMMRHGTRVAEVPCTMRERQGGTSYLGGISSIGYMLRTCMDLLAFQWLRR